MTSYLRYKKELSVVQDADDIESWITVKGNHIPIRKGQSKEEAVKSFLEKKDGGSEKENSKKDSVRYVGEMLKTPKAKELYKKIGSYIKENKDKLSLKQQEHLVFLRKRLLDDNSLAGNIAENFEKSTKEKIDKSNNSGKVYTKTMSKIRSFKAKEDGTYDFETGKPKDYPDGYSVSFHQNEPDANGNWKSDYGRYTEEDYDKNVAEMVSESGGELNIGYFSGTPEVSVWVKGIKEAKKLMKKYNQHSIWDWKAGDIILNPNYNPKENPMKQ